MPNVMNFPIKGSHVPICQQHWNILTGPDAINSSYRLLVKSLLHISWLRIHQSQHIFRPNVLHCVQEKMD